MPHPLEAAAAVSARIAIPGVGRVDAGRRTGLAIDVVHAAGGGAGGHAAAVAFARGKLCQSAGARGAQIREPGHGGCGYGV